VLEFQVKAHRDDWEAECNEKQQALQDKVAIELQVKELQKDIRILKHKVLRPLSVLSCCWLQCFNYQCIERNEGNVPQRDTTYTSQTLQIVVF
jgi:hypothetical protein